MRIITKPKKIEKQFTVDIEVEDSHTYQLSNGIVSHNTLSLLGGATPGIHTGFSKYLIRRVRMASSDRLVSICKKAGYYTEFEVKSDGSINHGTTIIEFPCMFKEGTLLTKDISAIQQLELLKKLQTTWADNSVSNTIYYKNEELSGIKEWLHKNYRDNVKSVSFLLHKDHGFNQAPLEEIDEASYRKRTRWLKDIVVDEDVSGSVLDDIECVGGSCPVK